MAREQSGSRTRTLVFWLGVLAAFVGSLFLAWYRMGVGLRYVDAGGLHFADAGFLLVFAAKVGIPALEWGFVAFTVIVVCLAALTKRGYLRPLAVLAVGGFMLGFWVKVVWTPLIWPKYGRIIAEEYIVDAPCLMHCMAYAVSEFLGPEDRSWAVPLALEVAKRPVGDNRWGAAYALLKYDDPRALTILIPDLEAVREGKELRYRGAAPPKFAPDVPALARLAGLHVGYYYWERGDPEDVVGDFLSWWEQNKESVHFKALGKTARGEPAVY